MKMRKIKAMRREVGHRNSLRKTWFNKEISKECFK